MKTAILVLPALLVSAQMASADQIRVLNWQGYGTDITWSIAAFEEATGHTVVHEYFNSEQEMLTKLRTNPGAYDVVMINAAFTGQAATEGLITPVDTDALTHYADLTPSFAEDPKLSHEGQVVGVPWTWGLTSIAVSTAAFPELPTSLQTLWDPARQGRISIRDDAVEAVQLGALATGQDINQIDDLDRVREVLSELMPQVRTFWGSENDWNQYMAAGEFDVATYWSGSAARSIALGLPVAFVVPEEGAVGWLDSLSIPAGSTQSEAALAFIDWMLDPAFYTRWAEEGAPASANAAAMDALPADSFNREVLSDPEVVARVQFQSAISDETRESYLRLWQALKAAQ
jgi:spermidine/putrescine transport system substrate-binding protein